MSDICFSRADVTLVTPHGFWLELDSEWLFIYVKTDPG